MGSAIPSFRRVLSIPLHRYRAFKRTKSDERADRIRSLADQLGLPIAALAGDDVRLAPASTAAASIPRQPFDSRECPLG